MRGFPVLVQIKLYIDFLFRIGIREQALRTHFNSCMYVRAVLRPASRKKYEGTRKGSP